MNKKTKQSKQEKFVLYLDIMGFKERVSTTPIDVLEKELLSFKTKSNQLKPLLMAGDTGNTLMNMAQFSDSIVLVTQKDTKNDLNRISKAAVILMQIGMKTGFALRGAIAKGEMVFDVENQLFFGKALVDAYLLEEELSYYGIVFHSSMEKTIDDIRTKNSKSNTESKSNTNIVMYLNPNDKQKYLPIDELDIPLKKGKSKHYHIAWYNLDDKLAKKDIRDEARKWLKDLRTTVSGNPRVYLDNTISLL